MDAARKTTLGTFKILDSIYDTESTHALLTKEEYFSLLRRLELEEEKRRAAEAAAEDERSAGLKNLRAAQKNAEKEILRLQEALAAEKKATAEARSLNVNLRRICRERANGDRGLPKKEHSGYLVLASAERPIRFKTTRGTSEALVWESSIQTPHTVSLAEESVRTLLLDGLWIQLERIGIEDQYLAGFEAMMKDSNLKTSQKNILLQYRLKSNFRSGFWEVLITHTKPLGAVPADLR